jgi:hypothetical protein
MLSAGAVLSLVAFGTSTGSFSGAFADAQAPSAEKRANDAKPPAAQTTSEDPFAGVVPGTAPPEATRAPERSWLRTFFGQNFGFRKEIMLQFNINPPDRASSRQSVGFEVLKKFSTETSTIASFNFQGRLVRRDGFVPVLNDMEGQNRRGWAFEYHNFYVDFFNVFNPLLTGKGTVRISAASMFVPGGSMCLSG